MIEGAMTPKSRRIVTATARANPRLLAGLRVRIGSDVYESNVASQLDTLAQAV
jgi:F-type H+-transporting ATPase subunit delta